MELVREMVDNGPYAARRWLLHTRDAQELYERFGFGTPGERLMEPNMDCRSASFGQRTCCSGQVTPPSRERASMILRSFTLSAELRRATRRRWTRRRPWSR